MCVILLLTRNSQLKTSFEGVRHSQGKRSLLTKRAHRYPNLPRRLAQRQLPPLSVLFFPGPHTRHPTFLPEPYTRASHIGWLSCWIRADTASGGLESRRWRRACCGRRCRPHRDNLGSREREDHVQGQSSCRINYPDAFKQLMFPPQLPGHKGTVTAVDFHPKEPISECNQGRSE